VGGGLAFPRHPARVDLSFEYEANVGARMSGKVIEPWRGMAVTS
jgi:hypothetical protein